LKNRKIGTLFSTAVAAAAKIIFSKITFSSLANIYTCHLKKKLVQNVEKQGSYDQKCFKNQKSKNSRYFQHFQYCKLPFFFTKR
jgi:hypothetical protein